MDLSSFIGNGTPLGIALGVIGYLLKTAVDWQRGRSSERREDKKVEREGDSQLVQTTDAALKMVRNQMELQKATIDDHTNTIRRLEQRIDELEADNRRLRRQVEDYERQHG